MARDFEARDAELSAPGPSGPASSGQCFHCCAGDGEGLGPGLEERAHHLVDQEQGVQEVDVRLGGDLKKARPFYVLHRV